MRKIVITAIAMLAVVAGMLSVTMHANAVTLSASARTCIAFAHWSHHHTNASLDAMLTASERAPWNNLGNDVDVVYADIRGGDRIDLSADASGIADDCKHVRR